MSIADSLNLADTLDLMILALNTIRLLPETIIGRQATFGGGGTALRGPPGLARRMIRWGTCVRSDSCGKGVCEGE